MADSHLILEFLFLQRRGGCSLTGLFFFLMLVGTCFFVLSSSHCVVCLMYRALLSFLADGSMTLETRCNDFIDLVFKL